MLRMMTTRSLTQAVYLCSGTEKFEEFLHYGLASPIYTHFTSPIRRYLGCFIYVFFYYISDPRRVWKKYALNA